MRKFFLQTTFLLLAFYALWVAVKTTFPVYFKGIDYVSWHYKYQEIPLESFNDATLVFGDSATEAALNPNLITGQGKIYNLAMPGGTPFDSYVFISRLLNKGIKPKRVFIIYSGYNYILDDGFVQQNLNFNFYSWEELKESIDWQAKNEFLYKDLNQFANLAVYFPFSLIFDDKKKENKITLSYLEYILSKVHLSLIDYNRLKRFIIRKESFNPENARKIKEDLTSGNGHVNYFKLYEPEFLYPPELLKKVPFPAHPFTVHFLDKTLLKLKEANIETVLAYSPIPQLYYQNCSEGFKEDFKRFNKEKATQFGAVFINAPFPVYEQSLFADQVHLNKEGVKKFTARFEELYFKK